MQAPWVFVTLTVMIGGGGFAMGRYFLDEKVKNLESRLAARDDKISEYQAKLHGASPDEAKTLIASLEKRLTALEPRELTPQQSQTLEGYLRKQTGFIHLMKDMGSSDAHRLYGQFAVLLRRFGWQLVEGSVMGLGNPPPTGIAIQYSGDAPTVEAELLMEALRAADIRYDVQKSQPLSHDGPTAGLLFASRLD